MDAIVSAQGLTVPKRMLRGVKRVHIQKKQGVIIITPQEVEDPLLGLGSAPARQSLSAGAKKHDQFTFSPAVEIRRAGLRQKPRFDLRFGPRKEAANRSRNRQLDTALSGYR